MKDNDRENTEQVFGKNPAETGESFQAEAATAESDKQERNVANRQITEEQARLLLEQDKFETEQRMKSASTRKKKVLTLVIGAVIFLTVIGVVMWLIVGNKKAESGAEVGKNEGATVGEVIDEDEGKEDSSESDLVELSLDDELVQRLYGQFDFTLSQFIWPRLFKDVSDEIKLELAIASQTSTTICKERYGTFYGEGKYNPEIFDEPWPVRGEQCVDGGLVRDAIKTVFGNEIELENKQIVGIHCSVFLYDAKNDEFIDLNTGCTGPSSTLIRGLYAAERNNNQLFLYEVATYRTFLALADGSLDDDNPSSGYAYYVLDDEGDRTDDYFAMDEEIDSNNIAGYKDKFSKFKWTFTKNIEGNYVFESLEKV